MYERLSRGGANHECLAPIDLDVHYFEAWKNRILAQLADESGLERVLPEYKRHLNEPALARTLHLSVACTPLAQQQKDDIQQVEVMSEDTVALLVQNRTLRLHSLHSGAALRTLYGAE